MPIDIRTVSNLTTGSAAKKTSAPLKANNRSQPGAPSTDADSVSLTETVGVMARAQELLASIPVVDSDHVATVAEAITTGNYEINSEQVAEKIIESEQKHPN